MIYSNFSFAHNKLKGSREEQKKKIKWEDEWVEREGEREGEKTNAKKAVGNGIKPDISPAEYKEHMWKKIYLHTHTVMHWWVNMSYRVYAFYCADAEKKGEHENSSRL